MKVLKNCRLIKELVEGYDGDFADILIDGKIIKEIRPQDYNFGQELEEIDLKGKTLMPGLFDIHAHLYLKNLNFLEMKSEIPVKTFINTYEYAKEYLNAGYTTIRDAGCMYNATLHVNNAIQNGIFNGPKIISSGQILTPTETGNDTFDTLYIEADGPDEMKKAARTVLKDGNDFIKFMATGAFLNEKGDPGLRIATFEEMKAIAEIAELKGTYVAAHCHGTEGIKMAIDAGFRTIEHGAFIDDEGIEKLLKKNNAFLVPTGAVGMACLDPTSEHLSEDAIEKGLKYAKAEQDAINNAYKAGLKLGFGSDIDMETFKRIPGYEFIARKDFYTFNDIDILLQATKYSAEIVGVDDVTGTIKEGKYADIIVVDGNPDQDIRIMEKPLVHVFAEGIQIY